MVKEKMMSIAILCLSISLIISANIISKGMSNNGDYVSKGLSDISQGINNVGNIVNNYNNAGTNRDIYNLPMAASYLQIPEEQLKKIVATNGSGIPYVKIGEQYIFSKSALDKWLETVTL